MGAFVSCSFCIARNTGIMSGDAGAALRLSEKKMISGVSNIMDRRAGTTDDHSPFLANLTICWGQHCWPASDLEPPSHGLKRVAGRGVV